MIDNDANLGALGECLWGNGRGCAVLVYIKLATGYEVLIIGRCWRARRALSRWPFVYGAMR
jgi:predicted NBD/HSP70 family sugar kinase